MTAPRFKTGDKVRVLINGGAQGTILAPGTVTAVNPHERGQIVTVRTYQGEDVVYSGASAQDYIVHKN